MSEASILWDYRLICKVLEVLHEEPEYSPPYLRREYDLMNPTHDTVKSRVIRIERTWDWRERVFKAFQCDLQAGATCTQMTQFIRYSSLMPCFCQRCDPAIRGWMPLERHQCFAWWRYYWQQKYTKAVDRAVAVIARNFDRWRVWDEWKNEE